jgi:hypothetical protein
MSLIDRLAQESIKQNKLISQLSEISYRAINGKRQNARNFFSRKKMISEDEKTDQERDKFF